MELEEDALTTDLRTLDDDDDDDPTRMLYKKKKSGGVLSFHSSSSVFFVQFVFSPAPSFARHTRSESKSLTG